MNNPWLLWKTGMVRKFNIKAISRMGPTLFICHDADASGRTWQVRFDTESEATARTEIVMTWLKEDDILDLDLLEDM